MRKLNAILFDVDGTLADTEELHRKAFNAAFQHHDLTWNWTRSEYAALLKISGGPDRISNYGKSLHPAESRTDNLEFVHAIHATKSELFRAALRLDPISLRPGIRRLIDEARSQGIKLALATCTSMRNVQQLLDQNLPMEWPNWFAAIVTSNQVREMKPAPAVYLRALDALGTDPAGCIAIEDTENGHQAALAAGLTTVVTTNRFTRRGNFPGAGMVLTDLGEPDHAMEVLAGPSVSRRYIDVGVLARLLPDPARTGRLKLQATALPAVAAGGPGAGRSNQVRVAHPTKPC